MLDRRQIAARMAIASHFCVHMADKVHYNVFFPSLSQLSSSAIALGSVPFYDCTIYSITVKSLFTA